MESKRAMVLKHRDLEGRPVIYIPAKFHNVNDRDIDQLTKFIVFCLVIPDLKKKRLLIEKRKGEERH